MPAPAQTQADTHRNSGCEHAGKARERGGHHGGVAGDREVTAEGGAQGRGGGQAGGTSDTLTPIWLHEQGTSLTSLGLPLHFQITRLGIVSSKVAQRSWQFNTIVSEVVVHVGAFRSSLMVGWLRLRTPSAGNPS